MGSTNSASRYRWYLLVAVAVAVALLALGLALVLFEDARRGLGSALVGGAIDIVFVGLLGGILAAAIKEQLASQEDRRRQEADDREEANRREAARLEQLRRLNEYRLRLLMDVVSAYHRIKAARRALRAAGFLNPSGPELEQWQIDQYWIQLSEINVAQLQLGKIERELEVDLGQLTEHRRIKEGVPAGADYLDSIITGWEENGVGVARGEVEAVTRQKGLAALLSHDTGQGSLVEGISSHMDSIERSIRQDMKQGMLQPVRPS
jgi:hypothetical protein